VFAPSFSLVSMKKPAPRESRMNDFLNRLTAGFWRFNGPGSTTDEEAAGVEEKTLMLFVSFSLLSLVLPFLDNLSHYASRIKKFRNKR